MADDADSKPKITFKKVNRKKNLRSTLNTEGEEEENEVTVAKKAKEDPSDNRQDDEDVEELDMAKLEETRELQRLRRRAAGVSHLALAVGKKVSRLEAEVAAVDPSDPFKLRTGGLLDLRRAKAAKAAEDPSATLNS